jgi:apolipoprotein N-acyltransferase
VGNYIRGKEYKVFKLSNFQFSATICWENLFSNFVRQFVKAGAQFIVNMTNEAWFGPTGAPYQFVSMNVFRAVENRVYVIRCTNTGISCFIDPNGRLINTVQDENGKAVFIRGVASSTIIPQNSSTIYTRFGDWFAWFSVLISISFLLFCFVNAKNRVSS